MEAVGVTYYTKHAPRSVADVNLCVVGVKNVLSSTSQKSMRKYISKLQKTGGAHFQYVGHWYAIFV